MGSLDFCNRNISFRKTLQHNEHFNQPKTCKTRRFWTTDLNGLVLKLDFGLRYGNGALEHFDHNRSYFVYSPRAGADNSLGTNVDVNRKPLSICPLRFKTTSLIL